MSEKQENKINKLRFYFLILREKQSGDTGQALGPPSVFDATLFIKWLLFLGNVFMYIYTFPVLGSDDFLYD